MSTMTSELKQKIIDNTKYMRLKSVEMTYGAGSVGAHLGGGFSLVEIMAVLYGTIMNVDPENPTMENRDRMVFSKGHGSLALYTALSLKGFISEDELLTYKHNKTELYGHPYSNPQKGIEFTSGSLGLGLALGIGTSLAAKRRSLDYKTYVILGDGEINEGTVWESAMCAAHYKLSNLVAIVDVNGLQYDGPTSSVMNMENLASKWESFGWFVSSVDGHNVDELYSAFSRKPNKPHAIIAKTIKGKGLSFTENNRAWHHSVLSKSLYESALTELNEAQND